MSTAPAADVSLASAMGLSESHLEVLKRFARVREVRAGTVVVKEGESSHVLSVVSRGELAITVDGGVEVGRLPAGTVVGEVSLFDGGPASATATATCDTSLLCLDREQLATFQRQAPREATAFLHCVCSRLAGRIRTSSDLLEALTPSPVSFIDAMRSLLVDGALT